MVKNKYRQNLENRSIKKMQENARICEEIKSTLREAKNEIGSKFSSVTQVILTGSAVRGDFTGESDVDLLVSGLKKKEYFEFYNYLEKKIGRKIDLIMIEDLSNADKAHLMKNKEIIYVRKEGRCRGVENA